MDLPLESFGTPMGMFRLGSMWPGLGVAWPGRGKAPGGPGKGLPLYMFELKSSLCHQIGPFFPVDINF